MKARKILFATVCSALVFSSCGNEDEPITGGSDKQFTVKLKTDFDLIATRATAPSEGNENVISDTKVLLYNNAGDLIGSKDITTSLAAGDITVSLTGEATTADVSSVYVLGNLTGAGSNSVFTTDAADFNTKTTVDNSNITVSVDGMQNENALLPFAGVSSSITDGAAAVNLKRKAARLVIKNATSEEITYEIMNVSTLFGGFMDETKVTDDAPGRVIDIPRTAIAADKQNQKLYLLPNTSTANHPVLKVTVGGVDKTLDLRLEANKAYTYTVTKVTSSDVTVSVTVDDIWSDVQEGELSFGGNAPHVAAEVPARVYAATVALPDAVTGVDGLTVADATNFSVTFAMGSGANAGKVMATVTPVRPYVTADISEAIAVRKNGATIAYLDGSQKAWEFGEVTFGNRTFMDRDLGAMNVGQPGELFGLGSLIPVDQVGAPANYAPAKANFTGNGRISLSTYIGLPFTTSTPWFSNTDGSKNIATDPCPIGWHIAKLSDLQLIFTSGDNTDAGVGNTDGNNAISGALNATLTYNVSARTVTVSIPSSTSTSSVFSANTGLLTGSAWVNGNINSWPTGWWTSTKTTDGSKHYNLSFNFMNTTAQPLRAQLRPNFAFAPGSKHAMLIRCVKD